MANDPGFSREEVLSWWAGRRLEFNKWLLICGIISYASGGLAGFLSDGGVSIVFGGAIYFGIANMCYSVGRGLELRGRGKNAAQAREKAVRRYKRWTTAWYALTLVPVPVNVIAWLVGYHVPIQ